MGKTFDAPPHILVIGSGITGLATAWVMLDEGYRVTIVSPPHASTFNNPTVDNKVGPGSISHPRLTSQVAGALWEYPPAVCGSHTNSLSLAYSKGWAMMSYQILKIFASQPMASGDDNGIRMRKSVFFFPRPLTDTTDCPLGGENCKVHAESLKMEEMAESGVSGFRHSADLIAEYAINPAMAKDAYELDVPVIDTDVAMPFLRNLVIFKGAVLVEETITGDLLTQEESLRKKYGDADVIVNASGIAAHELANDDTVYPLRGALIRVKNIGPGLPLNAALSISADAAKMTASDCNQRHNDDGSNEIVFIVPRSSDTIVLGGIAQPLPYLESTPNTVPADNPQLSLQMDSPVIQAMFDRCKSLFPALANAELDEAYPLAQGLRPTRKAGVRVERELRKLENGAHSRIIHSYGHGGSGWSLSFGCAFHVLLLVEETLKGEAPQSMAKRWQMQEETFDEMFRSDEGNLPRGND
ncbi:DAO-domain-containing protein [Aulographum hederae CBS 113979]|uniref:DAO-domain-containing protein n=1 Tax=Aulographum hederae CBS 113979 TaxID=1176131 RepID=A0A6G1GWG0_9PEZI|nr:DAO-domain-containing protein [Aulographum hederae CBS 113979]